MHTFENYTKQCRRLQEEYERVEIRLQKSVDIFQHLKVRQILD